jgi:uroporphyrinogen decarboxylase
VTDSQLTHRERMETLLDDRRTDRLPVALWRHFPVDDQDPETLARATCDFQDQYDFDLIKITPASSFQIKDWGAIDTWKGNPEGTREYGERVIQKPEDWLDLKALDPDIGWLAGQIHCASLVSSRYSSTTPVLQTVFSPLAQAKNLAGNDRLIVHLRQHPETVLKALEVITQTTIGFVEALVKTGLDGIFFAVQHAQQSLLTVDEFNRFGKAFDLQVLQAARPLWCNLVHIHGENILFDQICDYPVQIFNWHDQSTSPTLKQGQALVEGAVCGGLKQWQTLVLGDPEMVHQESLAAMDQTGQRRFLLGTGCVTPTTAPSGNILAARHAVEVKV